MSRNQNNVCDQNRATSMRNAAIITLVSCDMLKTHPHLKRAAHSNSHYVPVKWYMQIFLSWHSISAVLLKCHLFLVVVLCGTWIQQLAIALFCSMSASPSLEWRAWGPDLPAPGTGRLPPPCVFSRTPPAPRGRQRSIQLSDHQTDSKVRGDAAWGAVYVKSSIIPVSKERLEIRHRCKDCVFTNL